MRRCVILLSGCLRAASHIYAVPPFVWILKLPYLDSIFRRNSGQRPRSPGRWLRPRDWKLTETVLSSSASCLESASFFAVMAGARWHFREFINGLNLVPFENQLLAVVAVTVLASLILLRKRPALAVLVLIAESFYYLGSYNTAASAAILEARPPVVEFLKSDPQQFRIAGDGVFNANMAGTFGLQDVRGYDALTPRKYFDYMSAIDSSFPDLLARIDPPASITRESLSYPTRSQDRRSAGDRHSRTT